MSQYENYSVLKTILIHVITYFPVQSQALAEAQRTQDIESIT